MVTHGKSGSTKTSQPDPCKSSHLTVAAELCVLYHEAIRSEVAKVTKSSATRVVRTRTLAELRKDDKPAYRAFVRAARLCIELEADAREFVVAQFAMWREASAYHKKLLWPSPHHFGTLAAQVRYLQHKGREEARDARVITNEETDEKKRWFVEERQLKGLARVQRRDPVDVMTEQPERFSRDFLKHKGVWSVVKDLWEERQHQ